MAIMPMGEGRWLGRFGEAFGDATRRALYQRLLESEEPLSAGELAGQFGIHRTVARSHLERLVEADLLKIATRRHERGGRPAKIYSPSDERFELLLPPRRYESLAAAMLQLATDLAPKTRAIDLALSAGYERGREVAQAELGASGVVSRARVAAVAGWLAANGYRVRLDDDSNNHCGFTVGNCVFHEVAELAPEIVCGYDCAFIRGLAGADAQEHRLASCILTGDRVCRHEFAL